MKTQELKKSVLYSKAKLQKPYKNISVTKFGFSQLIRMLAPVIS
jgi:hypothetical protein